MENKKSIGLPGGPNEFLKEITQHISVEGYKRYSKDVNNPYNIIESGNITMEDVDFPVMGTDNYGNQKMMYPGNDYKFPGDQVFEVPMARSGGGLLTKTMKCNSCGWKWKAADGGNDVSTCHKCGGEALIKAQEGKELTGDGGWLPETVVNRFAMSQDEKDYRVKERAALSKYQKDIKDAEDLGQLYPDRVKALKQLAEENYMKNRGPAYVNPRTVEPQPELRPYEAPSATRQIVNRMANPITALGYAARGEMQPDLITRGNNAYDYVADLRNPFSLGEAAYDAAASYREDDYLGMGLNALGAIPALPFSVKQAKAALKNTYKINPFAKTAESFNNPNSFYRQIDDVTYKEGVKSGLIKGKQDIGYRGPESGGFNLNKSFGDDAYYKKGSLYYPKRTDYIYEVKKGEEAFIPKVNNRTRGLTTENTSVRVSKEPIPLEEATIYKKDWLKGYKEMSKQPPSSNVASQSEKVPVPEMQTGGEYTIKSGDTFYGIANKNNISKEDLIKANPGLDIQNLKLNQSIKLPTQVVQKKVQAPVQKPEETSWSDYVNPWNWGVSDRDDDGDFKQAFRAARKAGEDEFMWYGTRYTTDLKDEPVSKQPSYNPKVLEGLTEKQKARRQSLLNAANVVAKSQNNDENLKRLLALTAGMESTLGADATAYGRNYTRGPMSIDDIAYDDLFKVRPKSKGYTATQLKQFEWLKSLGYDYKNMDQVLRTDDPVAGMAAARMVYGRSPDALPDGSDPKALYNYYLKYYNKGGVEKHGGSKEHEQRWNDLYNDLYKFQNDKLPTNQKGGEIDNLTIYKNYIDGVYDNTPEEKQAQKVYDKLNRLHYRDAKAKQMTPANYVLTYITG